MKIVIAYSTFLLFIPFAIFVFSRLPKALATSVVVLAGSMMLPIKIAFDLPMVPPIDKEYLTYLCALGGAVIYQREALIRAGVGQGLEVVLIPLFLANIATAAANPDPMWDEGILEEGMTAYYVLARTTDDLLTISVPFFVARALITSLDDLYVFLRTFALAATAYTGLVLIEVAMSIPFKIWHLSQVLYGIPPHINFRWGLTQPAVFFRTGLALATFMACALIACASVVAARLPVVRAGGIRLLRKLGSALARNIITVGLCFTLNIAGILYGLVFLMAYVFLRARFVAIGGLALAILACVYPTLRMMDLFPYEEIVEFARGIAPDRAYSLEGRFLEEEHVLGRIGDRFWVGWGTYTRIPEAETFGTGETGLDGWMTIRLGTNGFIGLALYYLVFAVPVFRAWSRLGRADRAGAILIGAMMAMISIRMVDMIINGWWNCLPVFLAGALNGVVSNLRPGDSVVPRRPRRRKPQDSGGQGPPSKPRPPKAPESESDSPSLADGLLSRS